jgi:hypothetical protein
VLGCTTSLDQDCVEDFGRFAPAECLAWTVVEFVSDGVELDLGRRASVSWVRNCPHVCRHTHSEIVSWALAECRVLSETLLQFGLAGR